MRTKLSGETKIRLYYSDKATVTHAKPIAKGITVFNLKSRRHFCLLLFRFIFVNNLIDFEKSAFLKSLIASSADIVWDIISSFSNLY
jgi:hypothetical protein